MAFKPEDLDVYWEIRYYNGSMVPRTKSFTNEPEALEVWDDWSTNPFMGVISLKKIQTVRQAR